MTLFPLLSDGLLVLATVALAAYCWRLAARLRAFNDVDSGLGGAIAALSLQVDELKDTLATATAESGSAAASLDTATDRANDSIGRLEMLIAAAEDVADTPTDAPKTEAPIHFRPHRHGTGGTI
ncbi:MAG: hypothetical protein AAGE03_14590 [Pseudomonadota bacterium]